MRVLDRSIGLMAVAALGISLASCAHSPAGRGAGQLVDSLMTPSYYIDIRTAKGLDHQDLQFFVEDRRTRNSKMLSGHKKLVSCSNGEPNCEKFEGYEFDDDDRHFFISESGRLVVKRGDQTILWERGDWEEEGGAGQ